MRLPVGPRPLALLCSVLLSIPVALALSGCSKSKAPPKGEPAAEPAAAGAVPHGEGHGAHDSHKGVHQDFKGAEKWAKVFDDPERDAWQHPAEVLELLQVAPAQTVADIGAGTGYFVAHLTKAVGPSGFVIATDVEPDMISYLDQRAARDKWSNMRAAQVAAGETGLAESSVDRILIADVWHHIDDRKGYAAKLASALRPGGLIAVVDFDKGAKQGPPPEHRLAPEVVIEELRSAGLTAELVTEKLPEQYVVIARAAR